MNAVTVWTYIMQSVAVGLVLVLIGMAVAEWRWYRRERDDETDQAGC